MRDLDAFIAASDAYLTQLRLAHPGEPIVTRDAGGTLVTLPDGSQRFTPDSATDDPLHEMLHGEGV